MLDFSCTVHQLDQDFLLTEELEDLFLNLYEIHEKMLYSLSYSKDIYRMLLTD